VTQTMDQPVKPNGHHSYCACPECFQSYQQGRAQAALTDPAMLTADYARRIHWWVRLFGVLALTGMALWIVTLMYLAGQASARS
jgi:hypothetical protein